MRSHFERLVEELEARIIDVGGEVRTVGQAARRMGVSRKQIVKTLVVITKEGPVLAVLDGESRLDLSKFGPGARLATPREVKAHTGFEVGEVPPVGIPLKTYVDERVLENDKIYGGGGSTRKLVEIDPRRIVEHQKATVCKIRL